MANGGLKTASEIARIKGVSRPAISKYIARNNIQPAGKKGKLPLYDCSAEPLASYLAATQKPKSPPHSNPTALPETSAKSKKSKKAKKYDRPLNDILATGIGEGGSLSAAFYTEALQMAREAKDATLIFKLGVAADKEAKDEVIREQMRLTEQAKEKIALERAEHLKIENDIKKGYYVLREAVKVLFGRVYAVHTSVLTSIGLKLSDLIDALPPGSGRRGKIRKFIDNEIFSALETIQRLLIEYIGE